MCLYFAHNAKKQKRDHQLIFENQQKQHTSIHTYIYIYILSNVK